MKVVLAPDSFKGSLTAGQACEAMAAGVRRAAGDDVEIVSVPMADGGEGTVEALVSGRGGELVDVSVCGPLRERHSARFGVLPGAAGCGGTAVIEMAAAAGLPLVPTEKRNPLATTTYGLGELILAGLERGCREFVVGIGGSATNDCGCGMAQALGVRFLDKTGREIAGPMTGGLMGQVEAVDAGGLAHELAESRFVVACDVENPLLGPEGATYVYGPQKGAGEEELAILEANMAGLIGIVEETLGIKVRDAAGAGAAGGLGAGLMAFLGARLEKGVEIVLRESGFRDKVDGADVVISGEGRIDGSTVFGKTISGVVRAAEEAGMPVIALAGSVGPGAEKVVDMGVRAILGICSGPMSLQAAMSEGGELLAHTAEQAMRLVLLGRGISLGR